MERGQFVRARLAGRADKLSALLYFSPGGLHTCRVIARDPALETFVAHIGDEFILAQVLICKVGSGFVLRHVDDRDAQDLKIVTDFRQTAQFTETGAFRPLKAAPNLRRGWRATLRDSGELGLALNYLYPGALADWFAIRTGRAQPTNYCEFTARQTGMYRITAMLSDARAAEAATACCHGRFCLKQRLWTVPGLSTDNPALKSSIPCLEPCAIMLEFARKVMRMEQENMEKSESETMIAVLEHALQNPPKDLREADFANPLNPRRLQLLLNRLKSGMVNER